LLRQSRTGCPDRAKRATEAIFFVQARIIGLMAGGAAEMAILGDRRPQFMASDVASAHLLARIICRSEASRTALVEHGYEEALCIVSENRAVVLAIARALIEHPERTLDGPDIDLVIGQMLAREGLNAERARRQSWRRVIGSAAAFKPD
jgi:ATP-dependent Zn protease